MTLHKWILSKTGNTDKTLIYKKILAVPSSPAREEQPIQCLHSIRVRWYDLKTQTLINNRRKNKKRNSMIWLRIILILIWYKWTMKKGKRGEYMFPKTNKLIQLKYLINKIKIKLKNNSRSPNHQNLQINT